MTTSSTVTRKIWIDVLKGIGIVAVVAGHIGGITPQTFSLFRMPLFLFVAGYLFKVPTDPKEYLYKKIIHLIIPYIFFLFFVYVPEATIHVQQGDISAISAIARGILGGRLLVGWSTAFWFVTCLFFVQQLLSYLLRKFSERTVTWIMLGSLLISFFISAFFRKFWLPWGLQSAFAAAPFFYAGFQFKKYNKLNEIVVYILFILVVLFTYFFPENQYDIKLNILGFPFITYFSSLIVIVTLIVLAKFFEMIKAVSVTLSTLSKSSMVIMYLHQPFQYNLADLIPHPVLRLVVTLLLCVLVYSLVNLSSVGRGLLLGSVKDFQKITGDRMPIGQTKSI